MNYRELIDAYVDGSLTPEMEERLRSWLRADPANVRLFVRAMDFHGALRNEMSARALAAQIDLGSPTKTPEEQAPSSSSPAKGPYRPGPSGRRGVHPMTRRSVGRRPAFWVCLAAAGILVGIACLFVVGTRGPDRSETTESAVTRVRPERQVQEPRKPAVDEPRREEAVRQEAARLEAERKRAEGQLAALEREKERLAQALKGANQDEARRKAEEDLAKVAAEFRAAQERLEKTKEEERQARTASGQVPPNPRDDARGKPFDAAPSKPQSQTEVSAATVERVEGQVAWVGAGPVEVGQVLRSGQGLTTSAGASRAVLRYPDGTRLEIGPDTEAREFGVKGGKQLFVAQGTVRAEVARQPKDEPMVFFTPHAEAKVLGTTLRIIVDPGPRKETRLEVDEGMVRLKRKLDGKTVDVLSGHYAVAATGVELTAKKTPIDEIVLYPREGKIVGTDWKLVKDEQAATGLALEADPKDGDPSSNLVARIKSGLGGFVEFSFSADAGKEYHVWVRGCTVVPDPLLSFDLLAMQVINGRFTRPSAWKEFAGLPLYQIHGHSNKPGYWWVGGDADFDSRGTGAQKDLPPASIQFSASSQHRIRIHAEAIARVRIDAIWLSATQKTRPADNHRGPERQK